MRRFQLVLIKPSHYDDDGYVVQWLRSSIPSNSLAVMYTLSADAAQRQVLGDDTPIDITVLDETNTRVNISRTIKLLRQHANFGMVGLVGVQSNQFPRALDIARSLRDAGITVVMGGFHVSGCLAMLPGMQADLQEALDIGVILFAGEAETRIDTLLQDVAAGTPRRIYNHLDDLPPLEDTPTPFLPRSILARHGQASREFRCRPWLPVPMFVLHHHQRAGAQVTSPLTGRHRAPDQAALGRGRDAASSSPTTISPATRTGKRSSIGSSRSASVTASRSRLIIQVDTLCHKLPNFIEKAARAGVTRVFIGLENINPDNLLQAKKRQNRITEYRNMLLAWKRAGVITYAGYILGFPNDTPKSIRHDIEIIKNELPLDILEFFCLTPLPGSEDHKVLSQKGAWMDPDMNKYDLEHVVADHPKMTREEWHDVYRNAWEMYYTPEHMRTILRRAAAAGMGMHRLAAVLFFFSSYLAVENVTSSARRHLPPEVSP